MTAAANEDVFDIIGIGIGPFNLGLACLSQPIDIKTIFFDRSQQFQWHPGLMIEDTTLQIPFIADLVSFADPTSPYGFLNYLKTTGRLYQFYIRESMFMLRSEYNLYCQWVISKLNNLHFNHEVCDIRYDENKKIYSVYVKNISENSIRVYLSKNIVLGTGTSPHLPACCPDSLPADQINHSAGYLSYKKTYQNARSITIIGSGQSAAEIFYDLLSDIDCYGYELNWLTRSARFYPLEYTKLTLEMTSPDYVRYFYNLPSETRDALIRSQNTLYKGINAGLINRIYDLLYIKKQNPQNRIRLLTHVSLQEIVQSSSSLQLKLHHNEENRSLSVETDKLILATGYCYRQPSCLKSLSEFIAYDAKGRFEISPNYAITKHNNLFVQNVGLYSHGLATPDLGMACYRNTVILREILGYTPYPLEESITFQDFS